MEPNTQQQMGPVMQPPVKNKLHINLSLNFVITMVFIIIIAGMLFVWKPWNGAITANTRKITITGEATTKAEPDEFQFNPYYERDSIAEITKLNNDIVAKLKVLGVTDNQIKNNASQYNSPEIYYNDNVDGKEKTNLNITVTVDNKKLAQKVQDYLLTTNPKGEITPYPSFSTAKQKELEDKVRNDAIADARSKADKTAKELGAKVGKVIEVNEGYSGDYGCGGGLCSGASLQGADASEKSLSIQAGEDEFTYSVTVIFALK